MTWQPQSPVQGLNGPGPKSDALIEWDPDGAGPRTPLLVIGGSFHGAGNVAANHIATFDPSTGQWAPIGNGFFEYVSALAQLPNGDLVAAGSHYVNGQLTFLVARWNGSTWTSLGAATGPGSNRINALLVAPNGDLIAGGRFWLLGGVLANAVARWNGTTWSPIGGGASWPGNSASVEALATTASGDLVIGGWFTDAGGVPAVGIARWNGTTWSAFGAGLNSAALSIQPLPNGELVVAGPFGPTGSTLALGIARWNGSSWLPMGSGMYYNGVFSYARSVHRRPNGDIIACGPFTTAGGVATNGIARWDGSAWHALGTGINYPFVQINPSSPRPMLDLADGRLIVGGAMDAAGSVAVQGIAAWNGSAWTSVATGFNGTVMTMHAGPTGELLLGGNFTSCPGGVVANRVAERRNGNWLPLGAGMDAEVRALITMPNGNVVAGGAFATAGASSAASVATWNGTTWLPHGSGTDGTVDALAVLPSGDLVVAGTFTSAGGLAAQNVARWNGISWSPLGGGTNGAIRALAVLPNGELVAGGPFTQAGGMAANRVARWNGAGWSPLGAGMNGDVNALAVTESGQLLAGGNFTTAGGAPADHVARWDGSGWQAIGAGVGNMNIDAISVLPGDQWLVGGWFASGGTASSNIVRWNGSQWLPLPATDARIHALHWLPRGRLAVGGEFFFAGGLASRSFAELVPPCSAIALVTGTGCSGSGGSNVLTASALAWTGSTCRSVASGMPANGLALAISGFAATSIPLTAVLPQGVAGCGLWTTADLLDVSLPIAGTTTAAIAIPNASGLVGRTLYQQVAALELDATGGLLAVTTTNALAHIIGTL